MQRVNRRADLVVVVNGFPRLSETFVLSELLEKEPRRRRFSSRDAEVLLVARRCGLDAVVVGPGEEEAGRAGPERGLATRAHGSSRLCCASSSPSRPVLTAVTTNERKRPILGNP